MLRGEQPLRNRLLRATSPHPGCFRIGQKRPQPSGAPRPGPRVTFCTHKKSPKKRRETRTPFICLIGLDVICRHVATELNSLASDLCRVACPASAVALLKGEANLFSATNCLLLWEASRFFPSARSPRGMAAAAYAANMPPACLLNAAGPSGEVRDPPHRLRRSRRPNGISVAPGYLL